MVGLRRRASRGLTALALFLGLAVAACAPGEDTTQDGATEAEPMPEPMAENEIVSLLEAGEPVIGMFAPEQSAEGGVQAAENRQTDFIFYSLESGPWDLPTMESFLEAMSEASPDGGHPVVLRIPPIRDDRDAAQSHVSEAIGTGIDGLVLPHVESVEDIELVHEIVGDRLWPLNPSGDLLSVILIEDQVGIERARELVGAPGVGVAIPGPGDLRRAYEGDMEAVENAIQTVLAACLDLDVPCGITAGVDDIATRLDQGFRFIIVTEPEAIAVGLRASGRGA